MNEGGDACQEQVGRRLFKKYRVGRRIGIDGKLLPVRLFQGALKVAVGKCRRQVALGQPFVFLVFRRIMLVEKVWFERGGRLNVGMFAQKRM